jgi:signal transduction histidine kinase
MNVRSFVPDSIAGRTAIVLLVGLLVSHAAAFAIYAGNRIDTLISLGGAQSADRIATAVRTFNGATPAERRRLVGTMANADLHVAWGTEPAVTADAVDGLALTIANQVRSRLGKGASLRVAVASGGAFPNPESMRMGHRMMREMMPGSGGTPWRHGFLDVVRGAPGKLLVFASARLDDSTWINIAMPIDPAESAWNPRFIGALAVLLAAALALSLWAANRTLRPFAIFAGAAQRLGVDMNAPPLDERGPREVRAAAFAFNEMQRRLQNFLADRTQTLAAISHDLRTPITRLRLRLELIEDPMQRAKMEADLVEMETMIAATLAFARDEAAAEPRVKTDLAALLAGIVADGRALGHEAEYRGPERHEIVASPMLLRRALGNLIDNAIRYGTRARVRLTTTLDTSRIEIEDDGPGIPEAEQEKVFAPFYRLERSRSRDTGGTGLGLAVARNAILAHGGTIALKNHPAGGLTVIVTLPAAA